MQKIKHLLLACCSIVLTSLPAYSQAPLVSTCLQNKFCNVRLCDTCAVPFTNWGKEAGINYGKYNKSTVYPGDITYRDENDSCINTNVSGTSFCRTDSTGVLRYDVYYPIVSNPSNCPLPCVIFVHGGGFSDCNVLPKMGDSPDGIAFAQRGFIFINVEYRNGRRLSPSRAYPYVTVQQQLAIYRALQDITGAIRSVIKRQREQDSLPLAQRKPYQIDTNYLFLAGNSAGAITALGVAYYSRQSMIDSLNPYQGSYSISQALGRLNADYYYGDTTIEFRSKIKGVSAQWGSLSLPYGYDTTNAKYFFDQRIPVIAFHGLKDPVVPVDTARINFAPVDQSSLNYGNTYNIDSSCLITPTFKTNGSLATQPDVYNYGSRYYFKYILQKLGIRSEIYFDCDAMHGLDKPDGATFKSDYGTGYTTAAAVNLYIDGRTATFFQGIIVSIAQSSHRVFTECRNNRAGCSTANDDAGCLNNDDCSSHPH